VAPDAKRPAYSVAETSKLLSLPRSSIYKMMAANALRTIRIGERRLVEASEVDAILTRARLK
jgi:excisionase family DNA binding protein